MALLYGLFSSSCSFYEPDLNSLSMTMKWPGAVEHKIKFYAFSGGLVLNSKFITNLSDYVFKDEKNQVLVMFSGFIYNRSEIITSSGIELDISTPELIYMLFLKYGKSFANDLNGDFTIIIYENISNTRLIYRDHIGIRPLSYYLKDGNLWFSSHGIHLCKTLIGNEKISPDFIYRYFKDSDKADVNLLPLKSAKKLNPGSYLEVSNDSTLTVSKFWHPEKIIEESGLRFDKVINDLKTIVHDSVNKRSNLHYTAGAHLSGGLDSGIIAALARKSYNHQKPFYGLSWSSTDVELKDSPDEREQVEAIAQKCDIKPVYPNFSFNDFFNLLNSGWDFQEYFHETVLRKEANQKGIDLIFSGWGGDEFISINSRGIDSDLFFKLKWKSLLRKYSNKNPVKIFKKVVLNVLIPATGIKYPFNKNEKFYSYLLNGSKISRADNYSLYRWKSRREVHLSLLNFGHLAERTESWFLNGYRTGIEYRYPLLDKRIIEYILKVPSTLLFKNGFVRIILREISKDILPDSVTWETDKSNYALYRKMMSLSKDVFFELKKEVNLFKANPDLNFIDFNLLEHDIKKTNKSSKEDFMPLLNFLFLLKRIHNFTNLFYVSKIYKEYEQKRHTA